MERGFAVVGLGYVGLPVALALAKRFEPVIGFDPQTTIEVGLARFVEWYRHYHNVN